MKQFPDEVKVYCQHAKILIDSNKYRDAERYLYNLPTNVYDKIVDISISSTSVDEVFKKLEKHRNYVSKYFRSKEERSLQRIRNLY